MKIKNVKTSDNVLSMSEVASSHPLLETENIDSVLTYWPQRVNDYILAQRMPLVNEDTDVIEVEYSKGERGGLTPMVHMDDSAPVYEPVEGRGRETFEAASFREKVNLGQKDLYNLRRIGTHDELVQAAQLLNRRFSRLEERLLNRLEHMRKQVLFDGQVTATLPNKDSYTVAYNHPSYLEPVASTKWDNYSNAEPIAQLEDVIDTYELDTGRMVKDIVMPHNMMIHLIKNDRFQDLAKRNFSSFQGSREQIRRAMVDILGVGTITISRDFIRFQTDLKSGASNGANTVTLTDVTELEAGDNIYLVAPEDMTREKHTVSSISGNTVTISGTISRSAGFSAGSPVKYKKQTIPSKRLIMFGDMEGQMYTDTFMEDVDPQFVDNWGTVVSTRSSYANMDNPRPGLYTRSIDNTNDDPPHIQQIIGIRALPRIQDNQGWLTYQVLA